MAPEKLPVCCGDDEPERWKLLVNGQERWFTPAIPGEHDGYDHEQPIVMVDGVPYRVGMCWATRVDTVCPACKRPWVPHCTPPRVPVSIKCACCCRN